MAAGDVTELVAIWSQPAARMSAAVAAGVAPPTTNPKYRGPALATRPGSAAASRSARTCSGPHRPVRPPQPAHVPGLLDDLAQAPT
ncbi:hypothetical protein [Microbispora sp. H10830]|uniref:hypothetical protein n=1 Tax=Microbispora sp. H10830 TaxID=2729109 RepID=UPI001C7234D6|nr:hypothetical protein [Microbispora sp. H10830]